MGTDSRRRALAGLLAGLAAGIAFAAGPAPPEETTVTLSPAQQTIKKGTKPSFEVKVVMHERTRMLDVAGRGDLRDKLVIPRVTGGEANDLPFNPRALGPVTDKDYVVVEAGQSVTFAHDGMPLTFEWLEPGDYTVLVRFRSDWGAKPLQSNRVALRVAP